MTGVYHGIKCEFAYKIARAKKFESKLHAEIQRLKMARPNLFIPVFIRWDLISEIEQGVDRG